MDQGRAVRWIGTMMSPCIKLNGTYSVKAILNLTFQFSGIVFYLHVHFILQ